MPREGYLNYRITEERAALIGRICTDVLHIDSEKGQASAIDWALRTAAPKERTMKHENYIRLAIDTSDEAMFGSDPDNLVGVDARASIEKYQEMLEAALKAAFPDYEISLDAQIGASREWAKSADRIEEDVLDEAQEIKHDVWSEWKWIVQL
jgi:hypothetical protein